MKEAPLPSPLPLWEGPGGAAWVVETPPSAPTLRRRPQSPDTPAHPRRDLDKTLGQPQLQPHPGPHRPPSTASPAAPTRAPCPGPRWSKPKPSPNPSAPASPSRQTNASPPPPKSAPTKPPCCKPPNAAAQWKSTPCWGPWWNPQRDRQADAGLRDVAGTPARTRATGGVLRRVARKARGAAPGPRQRRGLSIHSFQVSQPRSVAVRDPSQTWQGPFDRRINRAAGLATIQLTDAPTGVIRMTAQSPPEPRT